MTLTYVELRARSKARYQKHKEAIVKRNALVGVSSLFVFFWALFYVAFYSEEMTGTRIYYQQSYVNLTQDATLENFWFSKAGGTMYKWTYSFVNASAYKIDDAVSTPTGTPAPSGDEPPAQSRASPDTAPDTPLDSNNSTNTTDGHNKTEDATNNTTRGHNKTEDAANHSTTRSENKTEGATNNTTRGKNNTEDAANNSTTGSEEETDSPYTVLRVLGDVAVFAVSFAGYGCYFFATQG